MRNLLLAAALLLGSVPAGAHRLDEYLQGTLLSLEKNRIDVQLTLTPGVAVLPVVLASIDTDGNGVISENEQRAYAASVLHDLSLAADGRRLTPLLTSVRFPSMPEMNLGRGEIQIEFDAALPEGGRERTFTIRNRHLRSVSAYQVNALVPGDTAIRIVSQKRNYSQSEYELDFTRADISSAPKMPALGPQSAGFLLAFAVALVLARLSLVRVSFASGRRVRREESLPPGLNTP